MKKLKSLLFERSVSKVENSKSKTSRRTPQNAGFARRINLPFLFWLILIITFLLRIPSLFEPHRYADEDIYFTLGMGMRRGLNFYRDIHDNKPPLIYILAGLAGSVFWLRLLLLVWHGLNIFLFYILAREIFLKESPPESSRVNPDVYRESVAISRDCHVATLLAMTKKNRKKLLVILTTALFSFLTTIPTFEGNIANGEIFMIMPATAGAYLLWKNRKKTKGVQFFWAGILFATAFLFKVPIMFDLAGIMLFLLFFARVRPLRSGSQSHSKVHVQDRSTAIGLARSVLGVVQGQTLLEFLSKPAPWLTLFGFLLPITLTSLYYASIGAFKPFFHSALFQNIGYLSSWENNGGSILQSSLFQRTIILLTITTILFFIKKRLSLESLFVSIWFLFSLFGTLLSGRPYPHYLIEVAPAFVLLIGLLFASRKIFEKLSLVFISSLVFVMFFYFKFWYYESLPYYRNFISFALKKNSQQEYFDFFGSVTRNYQTAQFIKERTDKSDKIFVWGTEPAIYVIADRLPVGRYTVSYHIADFDAWGETINELASEKPKFIIKMADEPKKFSKLDTLLSIYYILAETIEEAKIYKRINGM